MQALRGIDTVLPFAMAAKEPWIACLRALFLEALYQLQVLVLDGISIGLTRSSNRVRISTTNISTCVHGSVHYHNCHVGGFKMTCIQCLSP